MAPLNWSRDQSLVAFSLYWRLPFGRFHSNNPEIIKYAALIQRTPSALAMKLSNIASLDPAILMTGRSGLKAASKMDKALWQEMQQDWPTFVLAMAQAQASFALQHCQFRSCHFDDRSLGIKSRIKNG